MPKSDKVKMPGSGGTQVGGDTTSSLTNRVHPYSSSTRKTTASLVKSDFTGKAHSPSSKNDHNPSEKSFVEPSNPRYYSFGSYDSFMTSCGFKPWDDGDDDVGFAIAGPLKHDSRDPVEAHKPQPTSDSAPASNVETPVEQEDHDASVTLEENEEQADEDDYESCDEDGPSLYDSYGGYDNFMHSYGLKPWDDDDIDEGTTIITALHHPTGD